MSQYIDQQVIGAGGFGQVCKCKRDTDGKEFAKKRLHPRKTHPWIDDGAIERFRKEVRLVKSLDHPNIIKIIAHRLETEPYWFVTPLYRHSLADILPHVVGDADRIQAIFGAILDGMEYAHSEGVIHRDLKPHNVLSNGDADIVVTDFGLGRLLTTESTRQTLTGDRLGSLFYMPPEQLADAKRADERADIYSLGRMLYELHSGPLTSPTQDLTGIDGNVAYIIEKCTQQKPEHRFASITELKQAWQTATDVAAALSPYSEINTIITRLTASRSVDRSDAARLLDLLLGHVSDGDLIHEAIMTLSVFVIQEMVRRNSEATRRIIASFVDHITSQSWGFSYTDKIASTCKSLYDHVEDYRIRADLTFAVVEVGATHNRYYVMDLAESMVEGKKLSGETLALIERLRTRPALNTWIAERCAPSKLEFPLLQYLGITST